MPKPKDKPKKEKVGKKCHACNGTGRYFDDKKEKCNFCDGTGILVE